LGVFIVNKFAQPSDLRRIILQEIDSDEVLNGEVMVALVNQPQFQNIKIPLAVKNNIERLFLAKKVTKGNREENYNNKLICRKLLNAVLSDDTWAKYKFSTIMKQEKILFQACKGIAIFMLFKQFYFI
jgi:hypothetical protein